MPAHKVNALSGVGRRVFEFLKVIPEIWEHDKLPKSNTELLRHYTSCSFIYGSTGPESNRRVDQ